MKKLFAREMVYNRMEVLVTDKNHIKFIFARRRDDLGGDRGHKDTHWQLIDGGDDVLFVSPYRADLISELKTMGYEVERVYKD